MHHLPRIFTNKKLNRSKKMEQCSSPKPKLVRRNAVKNFEYHPSASTSPSESSSSAPRARSLDLGAGVDRSRTSFRVDGNVGEIDLIIQSLGLSGPEDFQISVADFEAMKNKSFSDVTLRPKKGQIDGVEEPEKLKKQERVQKAVEALPHRVGNDVHRNKVTVVDRGSNEHKPQGAAILPTLADNGVRSFSRDVGIEGDRPPLLTLPRPENFQMAAFEAMKNESWYDVTSRPKKEQIDAVEEPEELKNQERVQRFVETLPHRVGNDVHRNKVTMVDRGSNEHKPQGAAILPSLVDNGVRPLGSCVGIKSDRPPFLTPPPAMSLPVLDNGCSTWEILKGFAPEDDEGHCDLYHETSQSSDDEHEHEPSRQGSHGLRIGETVILSGSCSFTTTNDDDSSSTTTEPVSIISPNGVSKVNITQWEKGSLLGRGSFGSVYEGISCEGTFFAVKEVSLLEQDSQGRQSIYQLEQEIELLSQFEHENIVRYLGTEKGDSKLYIFLELVTQGSLAKLYQQYTFRDSHVSAYTRQILLGLKYLHDRNVVHRDIKCANILVASNGTVKLADFGLAKATRLNDLKSCKGTAFWMAPEVVNNKNKGYGLAADIWSLGCTVLEMLTGRVPYAPMEFAQAIYRIGRGEPPIVPENLSRDARDFIQQCIHVNPNDRPTAAELLEHSFLQRPLYTSSGSESPMIRGRSI